MADPNKLRKLKADLAAVHGDNAVFFASEIPVLPPVSSGSIALDFAVGGGFPQDRVVEIFGPPGVGKSTLGLLAMSSFLDANPERGALLIDAEAKLTGSWVEKLVGPQRMQRVIIVRSSHAEQATDLYLEAVGSGQMCFCLYDSIGGAPSKAVTEKSAETGEMGGNAKAITRFARLASTYAAKYACCTVGINQVRDDLGARYPGAVSTPGGHGWRHACVLRIHLKPGAGKVTERIDGEDIIVGRQVVGKCVKNQLAAPGRTATWWLYNVETDKYGFGIDTAEEVLRLSVVTGVVERRGSWHYHPGLAGGKVNSAAAFMEALRDPANVAVKDEIIAATLDTLHHRHELISEVAPMSEEPEDELADAEVAKMGQDWRGQPEE